MRPDDFANVKKYYPEQYKNAQDLSERLKKYWGRTENDFYFSFEGRELGQDSTCNHCKW